MIVCFKFLVAKVTIKSRLPFVFSAYYYGQFYYLQAEFASKPPSPSLARAVMLWPFCVLWLATTSNAPPSFPWPHENDTALNMK